MFPTCFPALAHKRSTMYVTSNGMSSTRSRSEGSWIGKTFSLCRRDPGERRLPPWPPSGRGSWRPARARPRKSIGCRRLVQFPFLEYSQERDLGLGRQVPDLVKEDRPAIGQLKPSQTPLQRARKCASLVSEQLGGNERRRDCRAIDANKRSGRPLRALGEWPAR